MKKTLNIRTGDAARTPRFAGRAGACTLPRPPRNALAFAAALEVLG